MIGETLGIWRLISVVSGFIGVMLILQPTSSQFDPILILPVICAFLYALTQVFTRKYCKNENPLAISYWLTVTFMISGLIGLIITWLLPVPAETGFLTRPATLIPVIPTLVIAAIAVGSLIMHFALASAYQNAPASLVAPLEYLYLPLTILGGYFFFDEIPQSSAIAGIGIIIAAGLIIAWRERKLTASNVVTEFI
jgi:drug/metabolite transporter (DMT)-like permease